ncbi:MAG: CHAT domain-containing protein [Cyanobacteria bacterium SBC]|nr:CHAT domain-containing protein [Cyanobacteria bacterium SBC]
MTKLVVLELIGNSIDRGFDSTLEVGEVGERPQLRERGTLPANPQLQETLQYWESCYGVLDRARGSLRRLKPKGISYGNERDRCLALAQELEGQFEAWLASDTFRQIDRRLREAVSPDEEIRLAIASDLSDLRKLPWHLWDFCRRYPNVEATFAPLTGTTPISSSEERESILKILAILGNDDGIDIEADRRFLETLPGTEITFLVSPQRQAIHDRLWEKHWDIIFFAGHSQTENDIGTIYINRDECLTLDELRYGLQKAITGGLQLAIFNSCDGLGLAKALGDCAIPHTIVMREKVPDAVAQAFLKGFLAAFSQGKGFHASVREARERLQGMEDRFPCASWLPAIVQHPDAVPPVWRSPSIDRNDILTCWRERVRKNAGKAIAGVAMVGVSIVLNGWGRETLGGWLHQQGWDRYRASEQAAAEEWWRWTLRVNPQRRATLLMLGHLYEQSGDEAAAEQLYRQAARRGLPVAYRKLAQLMLRRGGDASQAAAWAERGLALLSPDLPPEKSGRAELLTTLAWARWQQGLVAEATVLLDEVLTSPKEVAAARCLYGAISNDLGLRQEARDFWQQCAEGANSLDLDEERWRERALQELKWFERSE